MRPDSLRLALLTVAAVLVVPNAGPAQEVTSADYARAEQFLPWNVDDFVSGHEVTPRFFDGDRFWFRSRTQSGHTFFAKWNPAPLPHFFATITAKMEATTALEVIRPGDSALLWTCMPA